MILDSFIVKLIRRVCGKLLHIFYCTSSGCFREKGRVLTLHNVGGAPGLYNISKEEMRRLLSYLSTKKVIHLEDWESEDNFYALTIDDAYDNFYYNAFPLLKEYNIPFTIFVISSFIGKEGYMTSEQLREISESSLCTIGSHGIAHEEYILFDEQQARRELKQSRSVIENVIGKKVELFAYPYGCYYACGLTRKKCALDYYKYAFGTVACSITKPMLLKKYFLPRLNVDVQYIKDIKIERR